MIVWDADRLLLDLLMSCKIVQLHVQLLFVNGVARTLRLFDCCWFSCAVAESIGGAPFGSRRSVLARTLNVDVALHAGWLAACFTGSLACSSPDGLLQATGLLAHKIVGFGSLEWSVFLIHVDMLLAVYGASSSRTFTPQVKSRITGRGTAGWVDRFFILNAMFNAISDVRVKTC